MADLALPLSDSADTYSAPALPAGLAYGQVVWIDPTLCDVSDLNGRVAERFDPIGNKALVESIREHGQQLPVIVRASPTAGRLELVAGTRRLGAARFLRAEEPGRLLLAEVRNLDNRQAWALAEIENADRKDISPFQRAKNWHLALENLFGGSQRDLARSLNVDKSVVSRMMDLATLPELILQIVSRPEALRPHFAEKICPALKDERRDAVLALAQTLADNDVKLAPSELIRRLTLSPAEAEAYRPVPIKAGHEDRQAIWQRKDNGVQLTIKTLPAELGREDRKALVRELTDRIKAFVERT